MRQKMDNIWLEYGNFGALTLKITWRTSLVSNGILQALWESSWLYRTEITGIDLVWTCTEVSPGTPSRFRIHSNSFLVTNMRNAPLSASEIWWSLRCHYSCWFWYSLEVHSTSALLWRQTPSSQVQSSLEGHGCLCRRRTWWHVDGFLHIARIMQTDRQGHNQRHFGKLPQLHSRPFWKSVLASVGPHRRIVW